MGKHIISNLLSPIHRLRWRPSDRTGGDKCVVREEICDTDINCYVLLIDLERPQTGDVGVEMGPEIRLEQQQ